MSFNLLPLEPRLLSPADLRCPHCVFIVQIRTVCALGRCEKSLTGGGGLEVGPTSTMQRSSACPWLSKGRWFGRARLQSCRKYRKIIAALAAGGSLETDESSFSAAT